MRQTRKPLATIEIPEHYIRQGETRSVRPYQKDAMCALDHALELGKRRFLIELPTGTGKTDLLCLYLKRLFDAGWAERVLFLVDRDQLAKQALETVQDVLASHSDTACSSHRRCKMRFMKAADPRVTFAELQEWPDDGRRYELYDGEVIVVPSPFPRHQRVAMHIGEILAEYEKATGGLVFDVPIDIVFSEHNVVQPDVVYFRQERRHVVDMMAATRAAPDLAVEVLSRSTEARDRGRKMELLARFGVPEYWIVDPVKNTLEIYLLRGAAYELVAACDDRGQVTSPTLADLTFSARRVFAE